MHKPSWYKENEILIVNASTCGINKDGNEQYLVNPETGIRSNDDIDDELAEACDSIREGNFEREEISYHSETAASQNDIYVPKYYNQEINVEIEELVARAESFELKSLGELVNEELLIVRGGHGSPSSDQRVGIIPYIKVSDLRAGSVNINPTNMVPIELAKRFWRAETSSLEPYDLISPERASKNIGEFCVLMPGQQKVVLTKEVIIVRATETAIFDQFYLMWALSLSAVRKQWERIVFMQTNREDVGKRMLEILIPSPITKEVADEMALPFKTYYEGVEISRRNFINDISSSSFKHHIHLGDSE
jgi:type I restriction enzyme M protein